MIQRHLHAAAALSAALTATLCASAQAATYYVDASLGSDAYTGQSASVNASALSGPWRTLAKVSAAALQPGDSVLLRCGQQWRETLTLSKSGSAGQPITIGSYPSSTCTDQPAIDGASKVPADAWEPYSGAVYRALLPLSVLSNGRLNTTVAGWRTYSSPAGISLTLASQCPQASEACAAVTTGSGGGIAISPPFALVEGQRYTVTLQVLADSGQKFGASAKRFGNLALLGSYVSGTGNGSWQTLSFSFTANTTAADGRVDLDVPGGGRTTYLRQVRVVPDQAAPVVLDALTSSGALMTEAHHPNIGHNSSLPTSPYLKAGTSVVVTDTSTGRKGANYVSTGSDLVLPAGASLSAGLGVRVRSQTWSVTRHTVSSVSGTKVYLSSNTPYVLTYPGWGYFFTGALWMLDSPGEWYFDAATGYAYVWMPDGAAPGDRVSLSTLETAVQIGNPTVGSFPSYLVLDNLAIRQVGAAVKLQRAPNNTLRNLDVRHIAGHAVAGEGAHYLTVQNSRFTNLQSDAVYAPSANDTAISGNTIVNNGVQLDAAGNPATLPRESFEAIQVGARGSVSNNRITNAAYIGILAGSDSTIENNVVVNYGLVLNDGGGIYGAGSTHLTVRNNLVLNGVGNRDGIPSIINTLMAGLYADGNAGNYTVSGNTFSGADYCLQLHDAYNSLFENNTCFGARRAPVRIQETNKNRSTAGDVYGNLLRGNRLFNTGNGPSLSLSSKVNDVTDFGGYDGNSYSTLNSAVIANESWPSNTRAYNLSDWQASATASELIEPTGRVAAPLPYYARGLVGAAVSPQMGAAGTTTGWGVLSSGATLSAGLSCGPGGVACNTMTATTSTSSFFLPRFAVTQGKRYRVSFDAVFTDPSLALTMAVIRGSSPYDSLSGLESFVFTGKTSWARYSFTFLAASDASNARIDYAVAANASVSVANYEVVEVSGGGVELRTDLMVNTGDASAGANCPVQYSRPADCAKFFTFPEGRRVKWPLTVPARSSTIVFSQDISLPDADNDGIANSQDACSNTAANAVVNARGCALGQ